ncbi:MAG: hypothetical protein JJ975_00930 [Bacteroidia bacterium]|nr:hypothetical protein [Bacteroidia bacterium]
MYKKFYSLLLVLLVLFGSIGFTVNVHFCQGAVKTIGVFMEADGCGGCETNNRGLPYSQDVVNPVSCCSNLNLVSSINPFPTFDYNVVPENLNNYSDLCSTRLSSLYLNEFTYRFDSYTDTSPIDEVRQNVIIWNQVFLI